MLGHIQLVQPCADQNLEAITDRDIVLQENAHIAQTPLRNPIGQSATGKRILNLERSRAPALEILQHRGLDLSLSRRRTCDATRIQGVGIRVGCSAVDTTKGVITLGVLQERVIDLVFTIVATELQFVVLIGVGRTQVAIDRIGRKNVGMAATLGAEIQRAPAG